MRRPCFSMKIDRYPSRRGRTRRPRAVSACPSLPRSWLARKYAAGQVSAGSIETIRQYSADLAASITGRPAIRLPSARTYPLARPARRSIRQAEPAGRVSSRTEETGRLVGSGNWSRVLATANSPGDAPSRGATTCSGSRPSAPDSAFPLRTSAANPICFKRPVSRATWGAPVPPFAARMLGGPKLPVRRSVCPGALSILSSPIITRSGVMAGGSNGFSHVAARSKSHPAVSRHRNRTGCP